MGCDDTAWMLFDIFQIKGPELWELSIHVVKKQVEKEGVNRDNGTPKQQQQMRRGGRWRRGEVVQK